VRSPSSGAPLRILVKGSSSANWISFMGGPPTDYAYPRVIERELARGGRPAVVRNLAQTSERVKTGLKNWERQVYPWSPDVVVLNYGLFEAVHLFLPQPLERHVNSLRGRPGPVRTPYRRYALRSTWKTLAVAQQKLDGRVPAAAFNRRAARFADDLTQLILRIQMVGSPLVLLPEIPGPGERWATWFPGIEARIAMLNEAFADVAKRVDRENVRVFDTASVLTPLVAAGHDLVPDGGHFTPEAHDAIGRAMAQEIAVWCDENVPL
jgi:lysophospholipase L1-like esterase